MLFYDVSLITLHTPVVCAISLITFN